MTELTAKVGEKVPAEEAEKLAKDKICKTHEQLKDEAGGASGQSSMKEHRLVVCPHCYRSSWIWYDLIDYEAYECVYCNRIFWA